MKKIREWCELFLVWRKAKAIVRSMRLFQRLIYDKNSGMEEIVRRNAMRMASAMTMNYFDSKGIIHCRYCHSTDKLRKHLDHMVCEFHHEHLLKSKEEKPITPPNVHNGSPVDLKVV